MTHLSVRQWLLLIWLLATTSHSVGRKQEAFASYGQERLLPHSSNDRPHFLHLSRRLLARKQNTPDPNNDQQQKIPGSGLFPNKGPYIPSGLGADEYRAIKEQEQDDLRSKNFGAWGPRFRQTDRPDGDWMVLPKLWTNGSVIQSRKLKSVDGSKGAPSLLMSKVRNLRAWATANGEALLLAFVFWDTLFVAMRLCSLYMEQQLPLRKAAGIILRFDLLQRSRSILRWHVTKRAVAALLIQSIGSLAMCSKINDLLEFVNRRKLWSRRRTVETALASSIGALFLLAGCLSALSKLVSVTL